ncbi:MAG: hypothetical protein WC360_04995 [Opitutales bacterium]|jgi:hypothetical protein
MAIYLSDLLDNPRLLDNLADNQSKCFNCEVVLQETITGKRKTPHGDACGDCFYEVIGEEIEMHPLGPSAAR